VVVAVTPNVISALQIDKEFSIVMLGDFDGMILGKVKARRPAGSSKTRLVAKCVGQIWAE
jgi:hypothetical protein